MALGWFLAGAGIAAYVIHRRIRTYTVEVWRPHDPNDPKWLSSFYPEGATLVERRHVVGSRDKADQFVLGMQQRLGSSGAPRLRMLLRDYDDRVLGSWMREGSSWSLGSLGSLGRW